MEKTGDKPRPKKQNKLVKILKWSFGITTGIVLLISATLYFFNDHICKLVLNELNKELIEPIQVSDVDLVFWGTFPNLSVDLKNVKINDTFSKSHQKDTLLFSSNVRLQFNPIDLWNENYKIKHLSISPGKLSLKINNKGEGNYDILKPSKSKSDKPFNLDLSDVSVDGLTLDYSNESTDQHYKTTIKTAHFSGKFKDDKYTMRTDCKLFVVQAKSSELVLLANKNVDFGIDLLIDNKEGTIKLPKAEINIEGLPFLASGAITSDSINFDMHSKDILLTELVNNIAIDADKNIDKFNGKGEIYFDLSVNGVNSNSSSALITCDFGIKNGELTEPSHNLAVSDIAFSGKYSNDGGGEDEFLKLERVNFKTAGGPFSGDLIIKEFSNPLYSGSAKGNVDLQVLQAVLKISSLDKLLGRLKINADFLIRQGGENSQPEVKKCEGSIELADVDLKLKHDNRLFEKINGRISLAGNSTSLEDVRLKIAQSDLQINGTLTNLVGYIKSSESLNVKADIKSNGINVSDLGSTTKAEKIIASRFFVLPNNINGDLNLAIGRLTYENHSFNNLRGTMNIKGRTITFPEISCVNAEASIYGAVEVKESSPEIFNLKASISSQDLKFKPLFKEWNNFQQTILTDENLSGRAEASLEFEAPFDIKSGIVFNSIQSKLAIKVFNGHLKNIESFKDIIASLRTKAGRLVLGDNNINEFEKKLNDLSFETLENTIIINKGIVQLPKMKIISSAMEMDVSGTHTFENIIDYRFAFRLRDIKQQNKFTEFGEIIDDETSFRVFMRMHGSIDAPIIEWDKTAKLEQTKLNIQEAKQDAKSILKAEFGLFRNDSMVKSYVPKELPKEDIKINFNPKIKKESVPSTAPAILKDEKPKKAPKIKKNLEKWKGQQDEDNENVIVVGKSKGK